MAERAAGSAPGFRWRAGEVSRLEGFTDAVFAFAVTLLVVSLEVPHTFAELVVAMRGFLAFAICFVLLFLIWYEHYVYSRRYGLDDTTVVWLNGALIFVVLFYVYPLKFMFTMLVNGIFGFRDPAQGSEPVLRSSDAPTLFLIFGAGYVAVFLVFTLLYLHALRKRAELGLTDIEVHDTRSRLWSAVLTGATGVASILCVLLFGERGARWAGPIYLLNGITLTAHGFGWGSRRRRLEASSPR
jgi:hypothetical protein